MPTVPYNPLPQTAEQPLPRLRREPTLSPNAPTEGFGGGVASQAGTLGNVSGVAGAFENIAARNQRIALEEKDKADQVAVTDAGGQLLQYTNKAQDKWTSIHGKDAADVPAQAQAEYWDNVNVIRGGLSNPDQQSAFDKMAVNHWSQLDRVYQNHATQERANYDKQSTQAAIDGNLESAVKNFNDPTVSEPAISAMQATIQAAGERNGQPLEFTKEQIAQHTSMARLSIVKELVDDGQDLAAQTYMKAHVDDFQAKDLNIAGALTKKSSIDGEAQRQSDVIIGNRPATQAADGTTDITQPQLAANAAAAEGEVAKIADPEVRNATQSLVDAHYRRVEADRREAQDDAFAKAGSLVESGKKIPPSLYVQMGIEHARTTDERIKQKSKVDTEEGPGDREKFLSLLNMAGTDPVGFRKASILDDEGMNATQKTHLLEMQNTERRRVESEDEAQIQHTLTEAQSEARRYQHQAEATDDKTEVDKNKKLQYEQEQKALDAQRQLDLRRKGTGPDIFGPPSSAAGGPQGPSVPSTPAGLNLTKQPKTAPTPSMITDIRNGPPAYAALLDSMGVDTASAFEQIRAQNDQQAETARAEQKAKQQPKKAGKVSIERDTSGRATSVTRHPE